MGSSNDKVDYSKTTVLKRPDGTTITVPTEQAGNLEVLGYKQETQDEEIQRVTDQHVADYYSGTGQTIAAGLEGVLSGATVGLSDPLLEVLGDDNIAERAKYHAGARLGGELLGAIAPALVGDEEGLASLLKEGTPAGLLAKATEGYHPLVRGALEGATYGAGGEVSRASLTGDPLTAESLLAGAGWGGLFGAGVSSLGMGASALSEKASAALDRAEEAAVEETPRAGDLIPNEHWGALKAEAKGLSQAANSAADELEKKLAIADVNPGFMRVASEMPPELSTEATGLIAAGNDLTGQAMKQTGPEAKKAIKAIRNAWSTASKAAKTGNPEAFQGALSKYRKTIEDWAENLHAKVDLPAAATIQLEGLAKEGEKAFTSAADLKSVGEALSSFPRTPDAWVAMPASRAEQLHAALDKALSLKIPELQPNQAALGEAMTAVGQKLSVQADSPVASLRKGWSILREAESKRVINSVDQAVKKGAQAARRKSLAGSVLGSVFGYKAAKYVSKAAGLDMASMAGLGVYKAVKQLVTNPASEILGMKAAVTGRLRNAVEGLGVVGGALQKAGGRTQGHLAKSRPDPLKTKLDGTEDTQPAKNRGELFERRRREIADATGHVNDTLFRAVLPLHQFEPDVAKALHASASTAFSTLYQLTPKVPSGAFSMLKPLRTSDPVAIERFARAYETFHYPLDVAEGMLSGSMPVTADHTKAFQNMWPALSAEQTSHMLGVLSDFAPEQRQNISQADQSKLSMLTGVPLHSSMTPEFIAAQQQMFSQRNQLGPNKSTGTPTGGSSSGGGRPSATSQATQAQLSTER